jgi:hypothetical protein
MWDDLWNIVAAKRVKRRQHGHFLKQTGGPKATLGKPHLPALMGLFSDPNAAIKAA